MGSIIRCSYVGIELISVKLSVYVLGFWGIQPKQASDITCLAHVWRDRHLVFDA